MNHQCATSACGGSTVTVPPPVPSSTMSTQVNSDRSLLKSKNLKLDCGSASKSHRTEHKI